MMERPMWYILDENGDPQPEMDALKAGLWFETSGNKRFLAKTEVNGWTVSTAFVCTDMNHFGEGPPILFETMIFQGNEWKDFQERYATKEEALAGHQRIVEEFREGKIE